MSEYDEEAQAEELRRVLRTTQRQLAQAKQRNDELAIVVHEAARGAMLALGGIPKVQAPKPDKRRKQGEVALWHLTDWQGGKKTPTYNSEIMRERVLRFVDKAQRITEIQRADHPVEDLVILFGGDMLEGVSFNFPTQPFEIDSTLFTQYVNVSRLIVDVIRRALEFHRTVTVVAEWGNHGRVGSKRDAVPRNDNLDRMIYELARQLLEQEKRVIWQDCPEDVQRIHLPDPTGSGPGYRALLIHGDEIGRNGYASPMTIVRHVERWQSGAYPWDFRDCFVGHYHTHAEWPLANGLGSVYQTGSTESDNRYAGVMLAASATPSQRLHFVDPQAGRTTAVYKVWLDA